MTIFASPESQRQKTPSEQTEQQIEKKHLWSEDWCVFNILLTDYTFLQSSRLLYISIGSFACADSQLYIRALRF